MISITINQGSTYTRSDLVYRSTNTQVCMVFTRNKKYHHWLQNLICWWVCDHKTKRQFIHYIDLYTSIFYILEIPSETKAHRFTISMKVRRYRLPFGFTRCSCFPYIYLVLILGGALSLTITMVRNEIENSSSNPGRSYLRFTSR